MLERRRVRYNPVESIDIVDKALVEGDSELAESVLLAALKDTYTTNPDMYHHLALRSAAMPLYDIIESLPTPAEQEKVAQTTYSWLVSFIESELSSPDYYSPIQNVRERRAGRLSEDVVFSFLLRKFLKTGEEVPFPATHFEDRVHKIDLLTVPLASPDQPGKNIQVKTRSPRHVVNGVFYVSMDQLDPDFKGHNHEDSLTRSIVREAAGIAEPCEIEKLQEAEKNLDQIFA